MSISIVTLFVQHIMHYSYISTRCSPLHSDAQPTAHSTYDCSKLRRASTQTKLHTFRVFRRSGGTNMASLHCSIA